MKAEQSLFLRLVFDRSVRDLSRRSPRWLIVMITARQSSLIGSFELVCGLACYECKLPLMLKKVLRSLISFFAIRVYRFEYYLEASSQYAVHKLLGGNVKSRILCFPGTVFNPPASANSARLALFVAYHPESGVPLSNQSYLKSLLACGFRIIYIHNGPLPEEAVDALSLYCERVFCRQNIGQDFGAWKDGYLFARSTGLLAGVEWLLMCNDSNFFIDGPNADQFVQTFSHELVVSDSDLIALNKNYELWQHYQSYFLCFNKSIFTKPAFSRFWHRYRPLSHRYHAIENGEIALTRKVLAGATAQILYRSSDLLRHESSFSNNPAQFYSLLPQNALYLAPSSTPTCSVDQLNLQRILALLDYHNPSHVYALLFVAYLASPFLKKDLLRQGTFSMPQICALLAVLGLEEVNPSLYREIVCLFEVGGTNTSYIRYAKLAFRKGVNVRASVFVGHGKALEGLGMRKMSF